MSGPSKADLQKGLTRCRDDRAAALQRNAALSLHLAQETARADAAELQAQAMREALSADADLQALAEAFPDAFPVLSRLLTES